jgi:hypothetical protein
MGSGTLGKVAPLAKNGRTLKGAALGRVQQRVQPTERPATQ